MNDPIYVDFTDVSETEVELSAQDLLDLPPAAVPEKASQPAIVTNTSAPKVTVESKKAQAPAPRARTVTLPRAAWSVGLVIVAGVVVAANQMYSAPEVPAPTPVIVSSIPQQPDPVPVEEERPPTLAANPFDPSEVFELEPGLSKEEARAAVAQLLLERATQRQATASIGTGGGVRGR